MTESLQSPIAGGGPLPVAFLLLVERARGQLIAISMPRAGVANRAAGPLTGRLAGLAGDAHRAAGGPARDHVEGEALLVRAAFAKALDPGSR